MTDPENETIARDLTKIFTEAQVRLAGYSEGDRSMLAESKRSVDDRAREVVLGQVDPMSR